MTSFESNNALTYFAYVHLIPQEIMKNTTAREIPFLVTSLSNSKPPTQGRIH